MADNGLNIWCMNIKPDGGEEGYNKQNALDFCRNENIIGLGWVISERVKSVERAEEFLKKEHRKKYNSAVRFIRDLDKGDLVWIYDGNIREYYLCKVTSDWTNKTTKDNLWYKHDIGWYREANWKEIERDLIPGIILRNPRRGTLSRCRVSEMTRGYIESLYKFNIGQLSKQNYGKIRSKLKLIPVKEIFEFLDQDDVEDIVCNYLQSKGWRLIKSTASKSLPDFECHFRRNNKTAYVQVKTGDQQLTEDDLKFYEDTLNRQTRIYLFENSMGGLREKRLKKGIELIRPKELRTYMLDNISELNKSILIKLGLYLKIKQ